MQEKHAVAYLKFSTIYCVPHEHPPRSPLRQPKVSAIPVIKLEEENEEGDVAQPDVPTTNPT